MTNLSFETFRKANILRLPQFKNSKGVVAHNKPDGSDWSAGEWMNAILGELGEAANLVKKIQRGDFVLEEVRYSLAKEFADVVTYADIAAMQLRCNLTNSKTFNALHLANRLKDSLKVRSLGEMLNVAFGTFGNVARLVDFRRLKIELLYGSSWIVDNFECGVMAIDAATDMIGMDLGNQVFLKFNTISDRALADVFIDEESDVIVDRNGNIL